MEDYVKTIYHLQTETDDRVRTSEIANRLEVTPPTVTSMVEKLAERGLLDREKYGGVELTPEGQRVALEVIRHHRLLEAYLTEHLDYPWSEVHEEADRLEHHISEDFERRMAATLTDPNVDPHGDPIPSVDLEPPAVRSSTTLADCEVGAHVVIQRVSDRDPEVLEYLADRDIEPGMAIEIEEVAPFGMYTVRTDGGEAVALPQQIALRIWIDDSE